MNLQFLKIKLNNFNSYDTAELDLQDKGFCIVSGKNNYKKDTALSNGSGKSTISAAICYALTGETISGIKSNLKNINTDRKDCSVTLEFKVDTDTYIITRISDPKSDLKISKNGADISGKGIRESEKILAELFPDLTKNLIASTVILGQGMPNRLTSFSPSGRKELLEKLTNSDFMIEDVKNRISSRLTALATQLRTYEDSLLVNNTQLTADSATLDKYNTELKLLLETDYTAAITQLEKQVADFDNDSKLIMANIAALEADNEDKNNAVNDGVAKKAEENTLELQAYLDKFNLSSQLKCSKQDEIKYLTDEINKLKSIKDICPTCGQKIAGVQKPDTAAQENKIAELSAEVAELTKSIDESKKRHINYLVEIETRYEFIEAYKTAIKINKVQILKLKTDLNDCTHACDFAADQLKKYYYDKQNLDSSISRLQASISELNTKINSLANTIKLTQEAKNILDEHIAVVKKIDTLVKRDFRGYLLYNIIAYLNAKAKEYSAIVFNTNELEIYLDGNALDISYCGKLYENLSGGEKQRVDLIIQFAIRELLQNYFNYSSNILMLDEITDNLDKVATEKIFDLISNKLKNIESVFIISHHLDELGSIPIDSSIEIIKDENGISNIYSEM